MVGAQTREEQPNARKGWRRKYVFRPSLEQLEDRTLLDAALTAGQQQALMDGFNELSNGLNGGPSWGSQFASYGRWLRTSPAS